MATHAESQDPHYFNITWAPLTQGTTLMFIMSYHVHDHPEGSKNGLKFQPHNRDG